MSDEGSSRADPPRSTDSGSVETWINAKLESLAQISFFVLVVKPFLLFFLGLHIRGRENLPQGRKPFIVISNHSSHLDTATLLNLFSLRRLRHIRPVAAADYFERNPFISRFSKTLFHILPIVRTGGTAENDPRERMLTALRAGQSLILFPEGTRGQAETLSRFRSGIAHIVQQMPEVAIVPVYLRNLGRALPKGKFVPIPVFAEIRIGEPLHPTGTREEIRDTLEQAVRALQETA